MGSGSLHKKKGGKKEASSGISSAQGEIESQDPVLRLTKKIPNGIAAESDWRERRKEGSHYWSVDANHVFSMKPPFSIIDAQRSISPLWPFERSHTLETPIKGEQEELPNPFEARHVENNHNV